MDSISLFRLQQTIRQAIGLNFPEPLWVEAELSEANERNGHYFFSLWQKDPETEQEVARAAALLWASDFRRLKKMHGKNLLRAFSVGHFVRFLVEVQFHEIYGMSLYVKDVDTAYALGQIALAKQKAMDALEKEGLLGKNKTVFAGPIFQRIALISASGAAGLQDFEQHLRENAKGYRFDVQLYPVAVQGQHVEREITAALLSIRNLKEAYDAVCILRGGGAKSDLSAFDSLALSRLVAQFPLPILVGIGHQTDSSLLDLVAFQSLKTPTAVADFLIGRAADLEEDLMERYYSIQKSAREKWALAKAQLELTRNEMLHFSNKKLEKHTFLLQNTQDGLLANARHCLLKSQHLVELQQAKMEQANPKIIFQKGYTMTLHKGKAIASSKEIRKGDSVRTLTADGSFDSVVE